MQSVYSMSLSDWAITLQGNENGDIMGALKRIVSYSPYYFSTVIESKVGDWSRGRPEGSLFNSYNTEGRALLLSLDCSTLPSIRTLYCWVWTRRYQVPFWKSLVWRDLGLNPGLPDHWRTLFPLSQWVAARINSWVSYGLRIVWSVATLDYYVGWGFFGCCS